MPKKMKKNLQQKELPFEDIPSTTIHSQINNPVTTHI